MLLPMMMTTIMMNIADDHVAAVVDFNDDDDDDGNNYDSDNNYMIMTLMPYSLSRSIILFLEGRTSSTYFIHVIFRLFYHHTVCS